jgi:hypothetical protein
MATTETKSAFAEKMQGMRRDAEGEIRKMEAQIDRVKADARVEHEQNVKELKSKMAAAQTKLQQLQSADEAQWAKSQAEVERAWNDVKQSAQDAAARLRQG